MTRKKLTGTQQGLLLAIGLVILVLVGTNYLAMSPEMEMDFCQSRGWLWIGDASVGNCVCPEGTTKSGLTCYIKTPEEACEEAGGTIQAAPITGPEPRLYCIVDNETLPNEEWQSIIAPASTTGRYCIEIAEDVLEVLTEEELSDILNALTILGQKQGLIVEFDDTKLCFKGNITPIEVLPFCGDYSCDIGENCENCPEDCRLPIAWKPPDDMYEMSTISTCAPDDPQADEMGFIYSQTSIFEKQLPTIIFTLLVMILAIFFLITMYSWTNHKLFLWLTITLIVWFIIGLLIYFTIPCVGLNHTLIDALNPLYWPQFLFEPWCGFI